MKKALFLIFLTISIFCAGQNKPEIVAQTGQNSTITDICVLKGGRFFLTSSDNHTIKLWDIATNKEIRSFIGHFKEVTAIALSPDEKTFVSGGADSLIKLWDIETGTQLWSICGLNTQIWALAFSPNGKYIVSGGYNEHVGDESLKLWDAKTGKRLKTLKGHTNSAKGLLFSADSKKIYSTGYDGTIRIWSTETGQTIKSIKAHDEYAVALALSPDGKTIASGSWDNSIKVWDIATGKLISSYPANSVSDVVFSSDGKLLASACFDTIEVRRITDGKLVFVQPVHNKINSVAFTSDNNSVIAGNLDGSIFIYNLNTGQHFMTFTKKTDLISSACLSYDETHIATVGNECFLNIWDISGCKQISTYKIDSGYYMQAMSASPTENLLATGNCKGQLMTWDFETGKHLKTFQIHDDLIFGLAFDRTGKHIISTSTHSVLKISDPKTGDNLVVGVNPGNNYDIAISYDNKNFAINDGENVEIYDFETTLREKTNNSCLKSTKMSHTIPFYPNNINSLAFAPDNTKLISGSLKDIRLWDIASEKQLWMYEDNTGWINSLMFTPDSRHVVFGCENGRLDLFDVSTGKIVKNFAGHKHSISKAQFFKDGRKLLSSSHDGTTRIWDAETGEEIVKLISFTNGEWIIITPDGYFDGSQNCGSLIPIVKGMEVWGIDQFAIKNNRPDIILSRLGINNNTLIQHYYNSYKKRLRKLGFTEAQLSSELHTPDVKILDKKQENPFMDITFSLSDSKFPLKQYNIYINNVPLFGALGKTISFQCDTITERITLTGGENKIEISCLNEAGVESYRALTYAKNDNKPLPDLYFIGFGVSTYQNPQLNLQYAHKDALDLAKMFESMKGKGFANVYAKTFINEQVVPANIKAAKDLLNNAKPDDVFVLFIAGHGMHDQDAEATYYFLTHNTDIKNLAGTAANFEFIEDLLQGIAPRNKLFLMDACESGEIEDEAENVFLASANTRGLKTRGFKPLNNSEPNPVIAPKRNFLFQKERYIYNDLLRRSGAIVFSSSKGGEFSYEFDHIQNGLFTEYIMKALSGEADTDNNGIVSTDELRTYVIAEVAKASGDLQHPTVDRDNIFQKFGFGVK